MKAKLVCARILVGLKLEDSLPYYVEFMSEKDVLIDIEGSMNGNPSHANFAKC